MSDTPPLDNSVSGQDDAALLKETAKKMALLVKELRRVAEVTLPDASNTDVPEKGFLGQLQKVVDAPDEVSVTESREVNRQLHIAATALVEIYDTLGAIKLAFVISAIRQSAQSENPAKTPPKFDKDVQEILDSHYEDGFKSSKYISNRRNFILGSIGTAFCGGSLIRKAIERSNVKTERKNALRKQVDLEAQGTSNLSPNQRRELMELEKITLPELDRREKNANETGWNTTFLLANGAFMISALLKKGDKKNMAETVKTLNDILQTACETQRINAFHLPR